MKKKMTNSFHVEGLLYDYKLEEKVTGANSKVPGTKYVTGTIDIATDADCTNIVTIHYGYVTPNATSDAIRRTNSVILSIYNGSYKTVLKDGLENCSAVRAETAIEVNEFYTEQDNELVLVSPKRNNGGFISIIDKKELSSDPDELNKFRTDMIITKSKYFEANEEAHRGERVEISGYIFNYKKDIYPASFVVEDPAAMEWFLGLEPSESNPTFTKVGGKQLTQVIKYNKEEPSAFGPKKVKEVVRNRKDYVVDWAQSDAYLWDDESSITIVELKEKLAGLETERATKKSLRENRKTTQPSAFTAAVTNNTSKSGFNF